jgi:Fic family protein
MKDFDYKNTHKTLLTPEIVAMLTSIHEHKGKQELYVEAHADALTTLLEVAKIQSTGASNRIEGIHTTDKRLEELVKEKSAPRNRTEQEITGYRDVLETIHESYEYIYPRPNIILQLHKQLYSFARSSMGGSYKNADNLIAETDTEGKQSVRFQPVPAFLTESTMHTLCTSFIESLEKGEYDSLLLIPMFILDFLCIHPFNDGNGRMSRLLTLLLYYRAGYIVGKYISIEKLIEDSKDTYYEALQASSLGWHENKSDYLPFIQYYLGVLLKAYNNFEERVEYLQYRGLSKPDRIKAIIDRKIGKITKREIIEACPDISKITVERTLSALIKEGYIVKIGAGRATAYGKTDKQV